MKKSELKEIIKECLIEEAEKKKREPVKNIADERWAEMNKYEGGWSRLHELLYKWVTKDKISFKEFSAILRSTFFR